MSHSGLFAMAFMVFWGVVLEAGASEGERILYRGNPDAPFEGAWGEPDIDCGDPHGVEESECWKGEAPRLPCRNSSGVSSGNARPSQSARR